MTVLIQMIFVVGAQFLLTLEVVMAADHSPVLLFPGILGSQLHVNDSNSGCDTGGEYEQLWINLLQLGLEVYASPELKLTYNESSDSYSNATNVAIIAPGLGNVTTLEYLDEDRFGFKLFPYFKDFVDYFVTKYSYSRGKDLRGAPYDWRLAPDELQKRGYFGLVMKQIEEMYEESGNKVTLVAHSMGAPTSLYFLNTDNGIVTQQWKDQYIHAYVTMSGAWAGSPILLQEVISGNNLGLPGDLLDKFFRSISRTLESSVWLFPYPDVFKSTIVSTPTRNYTANDYMTLFKDIDYPIGYSMYKGIENIKRGFPDPKVHTFCYWGLGTKTPLSYYYNKSLPVDTGYDPSGTNYSDGDGRVNDIVSKVCLRWANTEHKTFEGVTHILSMMKVRYQRLGVSTICQHNFGNNKYRPTLHFRRNLESWGDLYRAWVMGFQLETHREWPWVLLIHIIIILPYYVNCHENYSYLFMSNYIVCIIVVFLVYVVVHF